MYFLRYYTHLLILHWVGAWKNVNDFTQLKNESFCRLYLNRIFFSPFSLLEIKVNQLLTYLHSANSKYIHTQMPEDQSSSKSNICPSVIYSNATKYKYHLIYSICTYKQYLLSYYIRDIFQNRFF